jgi:hypothetical protein
LICSPRKNCNSPIMLISNSVLISFGNLATRELDDHQRQYHPRTPAQSGYLCPAWVKQGLIDLSHLKPSLKQEPPQPTIPSSRCLLQPRECLLNLYTWWGYFSL